MMVMEIVISLILLFLGLALLVSIHVCIVGRAFRRANEQDREINGNGESGNDVGKKMSSEDLKKLPCFQYNKELAEKEDVDCAVCLQNFQAGDICRFLPKCRHCFHVPCIDSWILKTPICPICRTWVHSSLPISPSTPQLQQLDV